MIALYLALFVLIVLYLSYQRKFYWLAWQIRGPIGLPFIGCPGLYSPRNLLAFISKMRKSYKSPLTVWFAPVCLLYVADPENVERVLTAPECINKAFVYNNISTFMGNGIVTSKNPQWSAYKKLFIPAFKTQSLAQFVPVFDAKSKELCDQLKELSQLKKPLEIHKILLEFSFNIASETIMGQKSSNFTWHGKENSIIQSYNFLLDTLSKATLNPLYSSPTIIKVIDSEYHKKFQKAKRNVWTFVKKCIEVTSKQVKNMGIEPNGPIIRHAVEANMNGLLSTEEVVVEMNHVVLGSYETTATALLHIITLLAMHPEWQEKLYEEIEERFPDKDVELSFADIQDTPLTDLVIKEALRLLPVAGVIGRAANADFLLFDDVVVPKGTNIIVDMYSMHRDPKYWGADAMLFNPYRFMQDEIGDKHPFVYIPFSKGLRNCIGWRYANYSMKVTIVKVFQRFRFATTLKLDELDVTFNITSELTHQPLFTIENRASQSSSAGF